MIRAGDPAGRGTPARSEFSWIELVLATAIVAVLAGVVSIGSEGASSGAAASRIIRTEEILRAAAEAHLGDTGVLPREYCEWEGAAFHTLWADRGTPGWRGPYLDQPIQRDWNPCGGQIHVFDYVVSAYTGGDGFDLDGDGTCDVEEDRGSVLTLWNIDAGTAERVDSILDEVLGPWANTGRVEYQETQERLTILLVKR